MTNSKIKSYSEMISLSSFEERLNYLYIGNSVCHETFGNARWMNQRLYSSSEWRRLRDRVIIRDAGCDLGVDGCDLNKRDIIVHHINPITEEDVINGNPCIFEMDNLVSTSRKTHNFIHYGIKQETPYVERTLHDVCPWRKGGE